MTNSTPATPSQGGEVLALAARLPVIGYAIRESDQFMWSRGSPPFAKAWRAVVYADDAESLIATLRAERDAAVAETKEIRARWNDAENELGQAGAEEARADRDRYQWLRAGLHQRQGKELRERGGRLISKSETMALMSFNYWCTPEELDAAIDAAIAATRAGNQGMEP